MDYRKPDRFDILLTMTGNSIKPELKDSWPEMAMCLRQEYDEALDALFKCREALKAAEAILEK